MSRCANSCYVQARVFPWIPAGHRRRLIQDVAAAGRYERARVNSFNLVIDLVNGIELWDFVAGLGLFLFGMLQTEEALRQLIGGSVRRSLRRRTGRPLQSVGAGVLTTAMLQSSSLVALLTLAMVGARVIPLQNALGVVLGANLGTTVTGWIVASIGFKLDLASFALPLIAVGSIGLVLSNTQLRRAGLFRLLTAIGLLLYGMQFMKASVPASGLALGSGGQPWMFLALGVLVTAVIQSSSAAMVMALAALNSQAIALGDAAAFVIGADLGTTSTVLIGALRGSADKRRVGLAHFLINVITAVMAYFVLLPILLPDVLHRVALDPLFMLVGFHSFFNLLGVIMLFPFLGAGARFLQRFFTHTGHGIAESLNASVAVDARSALAAMSTEVANLARRVRRTNGLLLSNDADPDGVAARREYVQIKTLEGELLAFSLTLNRQEMSPKETQRLDALLAAAREFVHSAKSMKDCGHDLQAMQDSLAHGERALFRLLGKLTEPLHSRIERLIGDSGDPAIFEELAELLILNRRNHDHIHRSIFAEVRGQRPDWPAVSSLLNANRELFIANSDYINGLGHLRLDAAQIDDLQSLPAP